MIINFLALPNCQDPTFWKDFVLVPSSSFFLRRVACFEVRALFTVL